MYVRMYVCMYILTYICIHILIDGLREMGNTDGKMSSSAGYTTQNIRIAAMTSNAESEVLSTDQGIRTIFIT